MALGALGITRAVVMKYEWRGDGILDTGWNRKII